MLPEPKTEYSLDDLYSSLIKLHSSRTDTSRTDTSRIDTLRIDTHVEATDAGVFDYFDKLPIEKIIRMKVGGNERPIDVARIVRRMLRELPFTVTSLLMPTFETSVMQIMLPYDKKSVVRVRVEGGDTYLDLLEDTEYLDAETIIERSRLCCGCGAIKYLDDWVFSKLFNMPRGELISVMCDFFEDYDPHSKTIAMSVLKTYLKMKRITENHDKWSQPKGAEDNILIEDFCNFAGRLSTKKTNEDLVDVEYRFRKTFHKKHVPSGPTPLSHAPATSTPVTPLATPATSTPTSVTLTSTSTETPVTSTPAIESGTAVASHTALSVIVEEEDILDLFDKKYKSGI